MKNKGFTLVEVLAVITLLAIIALLVVPKVLEQKEKKEKELSNAQKQVLFADATTYLKERKYEYIIPGNTFCVKVNTLISEGYNSMKAEDFKNKTVKVVIGDNNNYITSIDDNCVGLMDPESFATDSWATIAANTTSDKYNVGDTRCVKLTGLSTTNNNGCNGNFKVRIANKTACEGLNLNSQTACGFVVEFVDIIATHNMNPSGEYKGTQYNYGWNVDGYPSSALYKEYFDKNATNSLYAKLPSDLQNAIIDTTVVSSHGSTTGETNFKSTDKLYLLSRQEVFGDNSSDDTAASSTRQLDYYNTNNNNASRKKQYNGSNTYTYWWLRSAHSNTTSIFYDVTNSGSDSNTYANDTIGVAPAFRIGS